ncbi:hypothetical protein [Thiobacillus sp.]|uniref:hypothetical protein n=1 Tax=Thiobacillus sp. TaxID=924 RepID=UPI00286DB519|nr:hypothetical protein [Thiobacillus sp.]
MSTAVKRGAATRGQIAQKLDGVDAIEIKATIPEHQIDAALQHYKLSIDNDEERHIYFFDTPGLDLFKAGMIARARRIVGEEDDSTVKFRPVIPADVPQDWRKYDGFKLEADASETGMVKSASLTMPLENGLIKQVVAGDKSIARLFTQEQEDFLAAIGKQHIDYDTLSVLGPLQAHRWKFDDPACPWRITAELWKRQDGARLMEMSIKVPVVQAAVAIAGFMAFLAEVGAERDSEQQTKTRWALDHHSALLRDAKPA